MRLTDGILDQLARYERTKTAERSRLGKLRRAREGKVIAGTRCPYGFAYNDARDNYVVDPERMAVVRWIFKLIGMERATFYAVQHELKRRGIPSPSGNVLWSYPTLRGMVLDDVYRPHTYEEIAQLVSPEVPAAWSPRPPPASGGSTAAAVRCARSPRSGRTESECTAIATGRSGSLAASGWPCRSRIPGYRTSG